MKSVLDTSEMIGLIETPKGTRELRAAATAQYDEEAAEVVVRVGAELRRMDGAEEAMPEVPEWLPKPEVIREGVDSEEASESARDIFRRWVGKVRRAAPGLHQPIL